MELDEAVMNLRHSPSYECIIEHVRALHDGWVRELVECERDQIERKIGAIGAYQELLDSLDN